MMAKKDDRLAEYSPILVFSSGRSMILLNILTHLSFLKKLCRSSSLTVIEEDPDEP